MPKIQSSSRRFQQATSEQARLNNALELYSRVFPMSKSKQSRDLDPSYHLVSRVQFNPGFLLTLIFLAMYIPGASAKTRICDEEESSELFTTKISFFNPQPEHIIKNGKFFSSIENIAKSVYLYPNIQEFEINEKVTNVGGIESIGYPRGSTAYMGLIDQEKMLQLISTLQKSNIHSLVFNTNEFIEESFQTLLTFLQSDACKIKHILFNLDAYSLNGKLPLILDAAKKSDLISLKLISTNIPYHSYSLSQEDKKALQDLLLGCRDSLKKIIFSGVIYNKPFYSTFSEEKKEPNFFDEIKKLYAKDLPLPEIIFSDYEGRARFVIDGTHDKTESKSLCI